MTTDEEVKKLRSKEVKEKTLKPAPVKSPAVPQSDAVKIYRDIFKLNPRQIQSEEINTIVKGECDLENWREACRAWAVSGNRPTSIGGILDWYKNGCRSNKPQGFKSKQDENMEAIKRSIIKAETENGREIKHKQINGNDGNSITG